MLACERACRQLTKAERGRAGARASGAAHLAAATLHSICSLLCNPENGPKNSFVSDERVWEPRRVPAPRSGTQQIDRSCRFRSRVWKSAKYFRHHRKYQPLTAKYGFGRRPPSRRIFTGSNKAREHITGTRAEFINAKLDYMEFREAAAVTFTAKEQQ